MRNITRISGSILLIILLYTCCLSCSNGQGNKTATTDTTKKPKWIDPCKGKIWSKVNIVQIPLTAYENHILGKVRSVAYKDYKLSDNPDSLKVLDDSGYNVYDKFGHLIDQNEYKADGTPKWKCIYSYDERNKATGWDFRFFDRMEHKKTTFKYDDKGHEIEQDTYDENGKPTRKVTKKYDDKGREIEVARYNKLDKPPIIETYKYDDKGNQIEFVEKSGDGKLIWKMICEFDNNGNKIGEISYRSDTGKPSKSQRKNDDMGRIIETISYNPDGSIWSRSTFKYDDWSNVTEYVSYDKDGKLKEDWSRYSELEYDATGNVIKETEYKMKAGKKTKTYLTETKYTYY